MMTKATTVVVAFVRGAIFAKVKRVAGVRVAFRNAPPAVPPRSSPGPAAVLVFRETFIGVEIAALAPRPPRALELLERVRARARRGLGVGVGGVGVGGEGETPRETFVRLGRFA
jgi:hypothetical protein